MPSEQLRTPPQSPSRTFLKESKLENYAFQADQMRYMSPVLRPVQGLGALFGGSEKQLLWTISWFSSSKRERERDREGGRWPECGSSGGPSRKNPKSLHQDLFNLRQLAYISLVVFSTRRLTLSFRLGGRVGQFETPLPPCRSIQAS